jgi:hypothetical protein
VVNYLAEATCPARPRFFTFWTGYQKKGQDMENIWKKRIKADFQREITKRYESKKNFYKNLYNKTKKYAFPSKDKINFEKHFYFLKSVVTDFNLSKIALALNHLPGVLNIPGTLIKIRHMIKDRAD